jgi:transposase-like protein
MCDISNPIFQDAEQARLHLEALRWEHGRACPHCGDLEASSPTASKNHKPGMYYCKSCAKTFTVTVGTIFERSHIPLNKWIHAFHLMASSKKGISAHQLHRMFGITYKSAWFMAHRIRECMKPNNGGMFGTGGATLEADATYVGGKEKNKHRSKRTKGNIGGKGKECVFSLVQRGGDVRSFHISSIAVKHLKPLIQAEMQADKIHLITDGERPLRALKSIVASHNTVNHEAGEYVRGDVHTNTIEGFFSILKRGIVGTFHHVSPQHLQRYVNEFDFRYNHRQTKEKIDGKWVVTGHTDAERATALLKCSNGKRLTYRRTNAAA